MDVSLIHSQLKVPLYTKSIDVKHMADFTACNASSIRGKGKESQTVTALRARKSIHRCISPVFLRTITTCDAYRLRDGRIMPCFSHVSRHLRTFSLQLYWNCMVRQVNGFCSRRRNGMFEVVTKT